MTNGSQIALKIALLVKKLSATVIQQFSESHNQGEVVLDSKCLTFHIVIAIIG